MSLSYPGGQPRGTRGNRLGDPRGSRKARPGPKMLAARGFPRRTPSLPSALLLSVPPVPSSHSPTRGLSRDPRGPPPPPSRLPREREPHRWPCSAPTWPEPRLTEVMVAGVEHRVQRVRDVLLNLKCLCHVRREVEEVLTEDHRDTFPGGAVRGGALVAARLWPSALPLRLAVPPRGQAAHGQPRRVTLCGATAGHRSRPPEQPLRPLPVPLFPHLLPAGQGLPLGLCPPAPWAGLELGAPQVASQGGLLAGNPGP